jgi:hypothetical protein
MKDSIKAWNDKYSEVQGTPAYTQFAAECQAKINGRWKFVGYGVPAPGDGYKLQKHNGKVYLVKGNDRYVIEPHIMEFFEEETK